MLTIFRTNQPLANIMLLFYLGIVRASTFVHPPTVMPKMPSILAQWLFLEINPLGFWGMVASFLLVFIQGIFINLTISRYRVASELSLLPGLFYCLVASMLPEFMMLSPILLANTFLILAMYYLFDVYKNNQVAARVFDVGLWIGVASLFYFPYILFVFWGIIGLGLLRGMRPKELLMFLIGITAPFILFAVFLYWNDSFIYFKKHFADNWGFLTLSTVVHSSAYLKIGGVLFLLMVSLLMSGQIFGRRNIAIQKYISLVYWMLLMGGITIVFQKGIDINHLLVIAIPLGILLSMLIQRISAATAEVLHMILLIGALIYQFDYLLLK